MTEEQDCCGPSTATNPKKDLFRKTKSGSHIFRLKNPITEEVKDADELKNFFQKYNLVPFAGTNNESGDTLLEWLLMLAKISPTNDAAISKKSMYAVGGKARIVRSTDPEFETGEESQLVSVQEAVNYRNTLKENINFQKGISVFHNRAAWEYEATGNIFIELTIAKKLDQKRASVKVHKIQRCRYVNQNDPRYVCISPVWSDAYLQKHPPRIVPIYPVVAVDSDGTEHTMFHHKFGDNSWYGRPPSSGADLYKYREIQDVIYLIKAAGSDFTGQIIIELEGDNPEHTEDITSSESVEEFEKNYTNKGDDPQSVVVSARPYGSKPMFVYQLKANTKESWYKVNGESAENKILRAHNCTPRFMGFDISNGFATDVFISDYVMNMEPVIQKLHDVITNFTNSVITAAFEMMGITGMDKYSIAFAPPIQKSIDEYKTANKTPDPQKPGQQEPQTPPPDPNANN